MLVMVYKHYDVDKISCPALLDRLRRAMRVAIGIYRNSKY